MKKEPEKIEVKSEKAWAFTVLFTLIAVGCILLDGYFMGQRAYMSELHTNPEIPAEFLVAIAVLGFCSGLAAFVIAMVKLFKAKSGRDARLALLAILLILFVGFGSLGAAILNMESRTNAGVIEAQKRERENNPKLYKPAFDKYDNGPADPQEILELVNQERQRLGVAPLSMDENVRKSAQLKADDMVAKGYRQHNIPGTDNWYSPEMANLMHRAGCRTVSENWVSGENMSSRGAFRGWMKSEPHRKAMQDPNYTKIGIGVSGHDGISEVAVQHFCIP